jgi:hypothetical protein
MTDDQTKKYEEAAKAYAEKTTTLNFSALCKRDFLAGATFAHNEQQQDIERLRSETHNIGERAEAAEEDNDKLRHANAVLGEGYHRLKAENQKLIEALTNLIHNAGLMRLACDTPGSLLSQRYEKARKLLEGKGE